MVSLTGQALEVLETGLKKEGRKEFINVGKFKKDHAQIGDMYELIK